MYHLVSVFAVSLPWQLGQAGERHRVSVSLRWDVIAHHVTPGKPSCPLWSCSESDKGSCLSSKNAHCDTKLHPDGRPLEQSKILWDMFPQLPLFIHCASWCSENWILLMQAYCLIKNNFQSIIKIPASCSMGHEKSRTALQHKVELIILNLRFCGEWKPTRYLIEYWF